MRQQRPKSRLFQRAVFSRIKYQRRIVAKLSQSLTASAARHRRRTVQICDSHSPQSNPRSKLSHRPRNRSLLRTRRQPIRAVLHIAARNNRPVRKQQRRPYAKPAIRRIRVRRSSRSQLAQLRTFGFSQRDGLDSFRHAESFSLAAPAAYSKRQGVSPQVRLTPPSCSPHIHR